MSLLELEEKLSIMSKHLETVEERAKNSEGKGK